ncbi:uncharacterized protein H6S33_010666 [Morchella sextelata]|uniref:uncharacterized protein n=1 Tax=Morchella sextelata TaxID=1174677 RepID=UPI001D04C414|nr:uncharacterized protein H6S33_010666 [Morchella sextelata]KAH0611401.1 hypothetical protein H6S33_010666 [Morchella sextelata]
MQLRSQENPIHPSITRREPSNIRQQIQSLTLFTPEHNACVNSRSKDCGSTGGMEERLRRSLFVVIPLFCVVVYYYLFSLRFLFNIITA